MERSATSLPGWPWPALVAAPGLLFQGFDSPAGQATACLLGSGAMTIAVLSQRPELSFWRRFAVPLALIASALVWLLGIAGAQWLSTKPDDMLLAPDLFLPNFLGVLAGFWALAIGLLCGAKDRGRFGNADWLLLVISLHATIGLFQFATFLTGFSHDWSVAYQDRFAGLIGNANVTACICGVGCVLAWSKVLAKIDLGKGKVDAVWTIIDMAYLIALGTNAVALALTASRTASVVTALAMIANVMILSRNQRIARKFLTALVLVGGGTVLLQSRIAAGLVGRMANSEADIATRADIWRHFAESARAGSWFGFGPGSFPALNVLTMPTDSGGRDLVSINSVHNVVLQLVLVGGLPYLAMIVVAAGLILRAVVRSSGWRNRDPALVSLALATGIIPVAGAADIALDMPASILVFAVLAGMTWARAVDGDIHLLALPDFSQKRNGNEKLTKNRP